jgi:small subunit ribosomal protein S17e
MGRIKSTFVKTSAKKIYAKAPEEFSDDFAKNKPIVDKYAVVPSKKLKNTIVGYITRLSKQSQGEDQ